MQETKGFREFGPVDSGQSGANEARSDAKSGTGLTQPRSGPVRYSKLTYDKSRSTIIVQPRQIVWLREVDAGTDNACWVACAKGDSDAVAFVPLDTKQQMSDDQPRSGPVRREPREHVIDAELAAGNRDAWMQALGFPQAPEKEAADER